MSAPISPAAARCNCSSKNGTKTRSLRRAQFSAKQLSTPALSHASSSSRRRQTNCVSPRYSFIIPAYNEEALIGRTIDTLRESASHLKERFEIIVANDDSTDRTAVIAAEKGARVIEVKKRQI